MLEFLDKEKDGMSLPWHLYGNKEYQRRMKSGAMKYEVKQVAKKTNFIKRGFRKRQDMEPII